MATYFVSRHQGAQEWAKRKGFKDIHVVEHFDVSVVRSGDDVLGTLPVNLAAQVLRRGGCYLHLSLNVPPQLRGKELSADEMDRLGAKLEPFIVITPAEFVEECVRYHRQSRDR